MKNINEICRYPVLSDGLGDIKLGMNVSEFMKTYVRSDFFYVDQILKLQSVFPGIFVYEYFEKIEFCFDIETAKLVRINLFDGFSGKYRGVGIGNRVGALVEAGGEFVFDDDNIMLNREKNLIFVADEDLASLRDTEILACRIESISILSSARDGESARPMDT